MNAESKTWIEFECPDCHIDYDIDDVDGAPQWPTHTCCTKRALTRAEVVAGTNHYVPDDLFYTIECDGAEPPENWP